MASIVGKKRGTATYYYLVESARVDGKPRIVSQEYLGTAEELAAAMRGGGLGLPDRTRHKDFGAVAAAHRRGQFLGGAQVLLRGDPRLTADPGGLHQVVVGGPAALLTHYRCHIWVIHYQARPS